MDKNDSRFHGIREGGSRREKSVAGRALGDRAIGSLGD
jgi:hypothetical protein